jgi:hypothetical protein
MFVKRRCRVCLFIDCLVGGTMPSPGPYEIEAGFGRLSEFLGGRYNDPSIRAWSVADRSQRPYPSSPRGRAEIMSAVLHRASGSSGSAVVAARNDLRRRR